MKFLVFEYTVLTILFLTLYFIGLRQKRKKGIIPVKDLRYKCKSDVERMLYDGLINQGIYPTPSVKLGNHSIPIALEQFKVAIFLYPINRKTTFNDFLFEHKKFYLRTAGWKVLKFSDEAIQHNLDAVIQMVLNSDKIKKI